MNLLSLFVILSSVSAQANTDKFESLNQIKNTYLTSKQRVLAVEQKERGVLSELYSINQKMKKMSRQRDLLTNKMLSANGNAKDAAKEVAKLESKINNQREVLSKKLRAIYKIRSSGVLPVLFSSRSSHDLDRVLKYLKAYSESDYELILNYQENLEKLNKNKLRLEKEVQRLVRFKKDLNQQEQQLEFEQKNKSKILTKLTDTKQVELSKLKSVRTITKNILAKNRSYSLSDLLDDSFFAAKGNLRPPVDGELIKDYGIIQHPNYNYKLSHKGHFYRAKLGEPVRVIHSATVAFAGHVNGYGNTIIVEHGDHYYTVYSYLNSILVEKDQMLQKGDVIGEVGTAVGYYGPGIYFEIRHFSDSIDPKKWLVAENHLGN